MDSALVRVVAQPVELAVFDPEARLERACELIVDAGQAGAQWIIFPEAYLPGVPAWLWSVPYADTITCELRALVLAAAVVIPGAVSDRLCRVAQRSRVGVTIGVVERGNGACYNSLLLIDAHGRICGHYRSMLNAATWNPVSDTTPMQVEQGHAQQEWAGGI
jgi:predicted amidohydrolase